MRYALCVVAFCLQPFRLFAFRLQPSALSRFAKATVGLIDKNFFIGNSYTLIRSIICTYG